MQSLYRICLEILSQFADHVTDYSAIPYDPYVHDLLETIMARPLDVYECSDKRAACCKALDAIGKAHATNISEMDDWTGVSIVPFTSRRVLQAFDVRIPAHFVCHLNMAGCTDVGNESIYRLKPLIHLRTLDLTRTRVSDAGVATIARIGMRRLRHLSVAETEVTDISLKYIAELARDGCLEGVDLTATRVDMVVATAYLTKTQGFVRYRENGPWGIRLIGWNLGTDWIQPAIVKVRTNPCLDALAMHHCRRCSVFSSSQAKSNTRLIYIKTRSNSSSSSSAAAAAADTGRQRRKERQLGEEGDDAGMGNTSKKPKLTANDYLSMMEADLGLI